MYVGNFPNLLTTYIYLFLTVIATDLYNTNEYAGLQRQSQKSKLKSKYLYFT